MSGGATPPDYADWRASTLGRITERLERAVVLDLAGPVAGFHALDVGAGDGAYASMLAAAGARVTALDRSIPAVRAAAARSSGAGEVRVAAGDAAHLPFADGRFDPVVAVTVLCFVDSPGRVVAELARVLRPGGRLVLGELGRWSAWAAWRRIRGWLGVATWRESHFFRRAGAAARRPRRGPRPAPGARGGVLPAARAVARLLAPVDALIGQRTTFGASFVALEARRRAEP